ncbi:MAG: TolC family protein [Sulfurimonas sp.]|uniref:TolC family protein n=1 Tax=Sulfurimonas sp. TaxID=2022749 RepID=UPI0025FE8306|nr:TolC family protein [Sulfurimonas sp.]MCK9490496.1 TolC family protein [Sulfurimonas sp.]
MQKIVVLIFFIFSLSSYANEVVVDIEDITQSYKNIKIDENKDYEDSSVTEVVPSQLREIDLIDVVLQTISASHKIKSAREKMIQAKTDVDIAFANYYPSIDASYTRTQTQLDAEEKKKGNSIYDSRYFRDEVYSLKLSQNLYAGGETQNDVERLRALYLLSRAEYKKLLELEIQKAIVSYVDVLFSRESLEASDKNIKELEKIFEIVKTKYDAGALSIGELSNIEASVSNAKTQSSRTNSVYINALEYFEFIVGESFEETYPHEKITKVELRDFDEMLESSLIKNSELQAIEYQILSKKHNLKKLKSAFRPKVDFVAGAERMTYKESVEEDEERYYVKLLLNYNLYNGGRDEKKYLNAFSQIKEKIFDKKAEIRRIKWGLEKFHTSLTSLQDNLSNAQKEVDASAKMVESYWESFRNGEQDLYVLLEAQRQLNTAELSYIQNQQDSMKDYFEILRLSGELLDYFHIDIENENYLDMAKSDYRMQHAKVKKDEDIEYVILDNSLSIVDKNTTTKSDLPPLEKEVKSSEAVDLDSKKPTLDGILSFHENFLLQDSQSYTIVISKFDSSIEALGMIDELSIEDSSFIYHSYKDKKIQTNIAYGIFKTKSEAGIAQSKLKLKNNKKAKIELIKTVQKSFNDFADLLLVDEKELDKYKDLLAQQELAFQTDKSFKEDFLKASEDSFTINITTLSSMESAGKIIENAKIEKESFAFYFGKDKKLVKLMMGIYPTYEDANLALENLGSIKTEFMPVIEKISSKQTLYRKFNE